MKRVFAWSLCVVAACSSDTFATAGAGDSDAAVDGGGSDTAPPFDAAMMADAGPTTYCKLHSPWLSCADFDESTDPALGWTGVTLANGGLLDTVATESISPPNAFRARIASPGAQGTAFLNYNYPLVPTGLASIDLDVALSGGTASPVKVLSIGARDADAGPGFELSLSFSLAASAYDATLIIAGSGIAGSPLKCTVAAATTANVMHHYAITFPGGTSVSLMRTMSGSPGTGALGCTFAGAPPPTSSAPHVFIGADGNDQTTTVYVDNLLVRAN